MAIVIGIVVVAFVLFAVLPMILGALGNLLMIVISLAAIVGVIALGVAFPPLGGILLVGFIIYALVSKSGGEKEE